MWWSWYIFCVLRPHLPHLLPVYSKHIVAPFPTMYAREEQQMMSGSGESARWPFDVVVWGLNIVTVLAGFGLLTQCWLEILWRGGYRLGRVPGPHIYVMAMMIVSALGGALLGPLLLIKRVLIYLGLHNHHVEIILASGRSWLTASSALLLCAVCYHGMTKDLNRNWNRAKWWVFKAELFILVPVVPVLVSSVMEKCDGQRKYCASTVMNDTIMVVVLVCGILSTGFIVLHHFRRILSTCLPCLRNSRIQPYIHDKVENREDSVNNNVDYSPRVEIPCVDACSVTGNLPWPEDASTGVSHSNNNDDDNDDYFTGSHCVDMTSSSQCEIDDSGNLQCASLADAVLPTMGLPAVSSNTDNSTNPTQVVLRRCSVESVATSEDSALGQSLGDGHGAWSDLSRFNLKSNPGLVSVDSQDHVAHKKFIYCNGNFKPMAVVMKIGIDDATVSGKPTMVSETCLRNSMGSSSGENNARYYIEKEKVNQMTNSMTEIHCDQLRSDVRNSCRNIISHKLEWVEVPMRPLKLKLVMDTCSYDNANKINGPTQSKTADTSIRSLQNMSTLPSLQSYQTLRIKKQNASENPISNQKHNVTGSSAHQLESLGTCDTNLSATVSNSDVPGHHSAHIHSPKSSRGRSMYYIPQHRTILQSIPEDGPLKVDRLSTVARSHMGQKLQLQQSRNSRAMRKLAFVKENVSLVMLMFFMTQLPFFTLECISRLIAQNMLEVMIPFFSLLQVIWFFAVPLLYISSPNKHDESENQASWQRW